MLPSLPLRLRDDAMVLHVVQRAAPPGAHGTTGSRSGQSRTGARAAIAAGSAVGALWRSRTGGSVARAAVAGASGSGARGRTGGM